MASRLFISSRISRTTSLVPSYCSRYSKNNSHFPVFPSSGRNMSSETAAPPRKFEWLVVVPDLPGTREKRLEVRPLHFAGLKKFIDSGIYQMGGAVLTDVPKDDQASSMDFAGSTVVAVASSREEVLEILRGDVYTKEGVWDIEKVQMWPLKCAFRIPVPGQAQ